MRKPVLLLAAVALGAAACSSTSSTEPPGRQQAADHHLATAAALRSRTSRRRRPTTASPTRTRASTRSCRADRDRESTFALDVDTASYTIAQRYVDDGNLPDPASVRVEEFVNAFEQDYAAPGRGRHVRDQQRRRTEPVPRRRRGPAADRRQGEGGRALRAAGGGAHVRHRHVGLDGPRGPPRPREAGAHLPRRPAPAARHRRDRRVRHGRAGSSSSPPRPRTPTGSSPPSTRCSRADRPTPRPASRLGYQLASDALQEGGINRVILASDGVANMGNVDPAAILQRIRPDAEQGIQLVTVGFGMGNYNDVLMEQLADKGDGFYAYVNQLDDARTLFGEQLDLDARHGRARRARAGRVQPRRRRGVPARRATRTARSPTTSSRTTASTPAPSVPATPRPRCTPCG